VQSTSNVAAVRTSRWLLKSPDKLLNPQFALLRSLVECIQSQLEQPGDTIDRNQEVDIVISGGGLRGYYVTGAFIVLKQLQEAFGWKICRFAGASAGSWCAVFMACGMDIVDWVETYYQTRLHSQASGRPLLDAYHCFLDSMMLITLPGNAHVLCSGKVFLSITVVEAGFVRNLVVSEFFSKQDVVDACIASSNIPFLATSGLGKRFRGMRVLDGGVTNNIPYFRDDARKQIAFNLSKVQYPLSLTLSASDPSIEALLVRGALEMRAFVTTPGYRVASIEVVEKGQRPRSSLSAWLRCVAPAKSVLLVLLVALLYRRFKRRRFTYGLPSGTLLL